MNYIQIEKKIMKQSFPKLSEQDLKDIFKMYPNRSQSESRLTVAYNRHLDLEKWYPV